MDNYEYTELLKTLQLKLDNIQGVVNPDAINTRLKEIAELESEPDFWNDAKRAANLAKETTQIERKLERFEVTAATLEKLFGHNLFVSSPVVRQPAR